MFTQSGAPGRVIGWTNSYTSTQYIDFVDNFTFQWICLPIILLILVGVELPLRAVVTILECCVTFSGVKFSIRSFVLFIIICETSLPNSANLI